MSRMRLYPDSVSARRVTGGDLVAFAGLGVCPFRRFPVAWVGFVGCDQVEPFPTLVSGFVGVEDGVVAEAVGPKLRVGASAAAEQAEDPRCGDGALGDRGPVEPLWLVGLGAEFGVEDVLPHVGCERRLVAAWWPVAGV